MANSSITQPPDDLKLRRRGIPQLPEVGGWARYQAMLASMLFHVTVLVTIGALWTSRPKGTGGQPDRPVGIAVVHQVDGGEAYFLPDSGASQLGQSESTTESALAASLPSTESITTNTDETLAGLLPNDGGLAGNASEATGGLGLGDGGSRVGGNRDIPKVKTSVFGIEGEGTRFIYVFDCSDSMNGYSGLPLEAAKRELIQSLKSLGRAHQFQIIFYNDEPFPYGGLNGGRARLLYGDEETKKHAINFVRGKSATGGTRHVEALKLGISMGPDVIFFLTDADQPAPSSRNREEILERCARGGTTLHSIQFGAGPNQGTGSWIEKLATETAGKYRYIDVSKPSFMSNER